MSGPERTWLRRASDGQRGYLVQRPDGSEHVRSDRPGDATEYPYTPENWHIEEDFRPFSRAQAAEAAFVADKVLCRLLGLHDKARKEWLSLRPNERALWADEGPASPNVRAELHEAIMGVLGRYSSA